MPTPAPNVTVGPIDAAFGSPFPLTAAERDERLAELAAAEARWSANHPSTYAYTFDEVGEMWGWGARVSAIDGGVQVQALDVGRSGRGDLASATIDGLFSAIRRDVEAGVVVSTTYDRDLGYPRTILRSIPGATDGTSTDTVSKFRSHDQLDVTSVRRTLREARAAWAANAPSAFSYVWTRSGVSSGTTDGTAWHVDSRDGRVTVEAAPGSDGLAPAAAASIERTFDAIDDALDGGSWVDLTAGFTSGVPLLAAVDPAGGGAANGFWIRITFTDVEASEASTAVQAARERWATAAIEHYAYTWQYRGELRTLTYEVVMDGDVAQLHRAPGTPIPEATFTAPRIEDTFDVIENVLAQGGHVTATYDPRTGCPLVVTIRSAGDAGPPGTITIRDFTVR